MVYQEVWSNAAVGQQESEGWVGKEQKGEDSGAYTLPTPAPGHLNLTQSPPNSLLRISGPTSRSHHGDGCCHPGLNFFLYLFFFFFFFGKSGKGVKGLVVSPSSFSSSFFKKICWVNAFGQWRPISLRFFLRRGISKPIGLFYACAELLTEIFQLSSEAQNARSAAVTSRKFGIWKPGIKGRTFNFSLV